MRSLRVAALLPALWLGGCQDNETAIARGDRLWADSSYTSALAEYRLAASQRDDDEALLRLAHTLARTGEPDEARALYDRLLEQADAYRDQAVYDLLHVADRALARNDVHTAAAALDDALALRPELVARRGVSEVASLYQERDQPDRAIRYYRRALTASPPDSVVTLLYRIGRLEAERGRCATAIDYFRAFREQASASDERRYRALLSEARWHTGSCALDLAMAARDSGDTDLALDHLEQMIRLGEPENRLDQAWFERGELLLDAGAQDEALAAYRRVLERNPARTGRLVERAQERIDQIRFGSAPVGRPGALPDTIDSSPDESAGEPTGAGPASGTGSGPVRNPGERRAG